MEIDDMWDDEEDVAPFIKKVANPKPPIDSMSLRDWFAAQALPTIIQVCAGDTRGDGETIAQLFARKSYGIADAMLEARALK